MEIIVFDTETNGFKGTSVLSISALKLKYDRNKEMFYKIEEYDRYYFRNEGEDLNEKAIEINGLTDEEIEKRRKLQKENKGLEYPKTFLEDINSFKEFCQNADHYIAHNIKYDRDFLPYELKYQFDTMLANIGILRIPNKFGYKFPKLIECVDYYNIKLDKQQLHNSLYDVYMTAKLFCKMTSFKNSDCLNFLNKNISNV